MVDLSNWYSPINTTSSGNTIGEDKIFKKTFSLCNSDIFCKLVFILRFF
jgi:hypothetical protein